MTGMQPVYCPIVQDSFHHGLDPCGVSSMLLCSGVALLLVIGTQWLSS